VTRTLYTALVSLLLPFAWLRLMWRSRREPGYARHVAERFGHYGARPTQPVIWLHAVSLGETRGAEPLVNALLAQYPGHCLLLTHMTPTGRGAGQDLFGDQVRQAYLPYDYPAAVARFLDHFTPRVGIVMETEIWPTLVRACRNRNLPLLLVNARMSERSARGYSRFPEFVSEVLNELTAIVAQTEGDAQRFRALGAREVTVVGNLKFDILPGAAQLALGDSFRAGYGTRTVLLAASTREGEEELILDALAKIVTPDLLLVIVPRHPQRFDEVAKLVSARGLSSQRRSENRAVAADTRILIGDSLGELFAYYRAADIAFVGGSLVQWGGHNLIEACAVGTPVLVGPFTMNFAEATESAIAEGAALRVATADEFAQAVQTLLADKQRRQDMHQAALTFASRHRGATAHMLTLISRVMR
jgi:3-deoxy-D-manno-octulosonic-acid transferase